MLLLDLLRASDAAVTTLLKQISEIVVALSAGGALTTAIVVACALIAVRSKGCCSQDGIFRSHVI
jgi:hypothetical protein